MSFMANDTVKRAAPKKAPTKATTRAPKKAPAATKTTPPAAAAGPPPGWYTSAGYPDHERYWDGAGWDVSQGSRPVGGAPTEDVPSTEQAAEGETGGDGGGADPGTITFRGRVMKVVRPTDDQLAVWKIIATRAEQVSKDFGKPKPCTACQGKGCDECMDTGSAHTAEIFKLFNRAMKIITSVLPDEADKDWLEDELIAGQVDLLAAGEIVKLAVQTLIAGQAKTAAPRTGPTAKARRRR